jgi:hypothetical protein
LIILPLTCGSGYWFSSEQLAPNADAGDALYSDGRENYWYVPTTGGSDLDEAYDAGNTIDYTGYATEADAVILNAGTGGAGYTALKIIDGYLKGVYSITSDPTYGFDSAAGYGRVFICDPNGLFSFAADATTGAVTMNSLNNSGGDLTWYGTTGYILADANANVVTVVPTEYIGDGDTAGNLYIADGGGNYTKYPNTDLPAGGEFLGCSGVPISGVYSLDWTAPAGTNYIFKTLDCSSGTDPVADAVDDTATFKAGTGMTVTGNSAADSVTWATTITQWTDELSQDAIFPAATLVIGAGLSGAYDDANNHYDLASTITQATDTDTESYVIYTAAAVTLSTSYQQVGNSYPVVASGTVTAIALNFVTWTPAAGTDTVTVAIYIDGGIQGTWTGTQGAPGCYSKVVSGGTNTITASPTVSHYISVWAKKTSNGTTDAITVATPVVQVAIV